MMDGNGATVATEEESLGTQIIVAADFDGKLRVYSKFVKP